MEQASGRGAGEAVLPEGDQNGGDQGFRTGRRREGKAKAAKITRAARAPCGVSGAGPPCRVRPVPSDGAPAGRHPCAFRAPVPRDTRPPRLYRVHGRRAPRGAWVRDKPPVACHGPPRDFLGALSVSWRPRLSRAPRLFRAAEPPRARARNPAARLVSPGTGARKASLIGAHSF